MNNAPADPLSWYYDIPVVTRVYLTGAFVTTVSHFSLCLVRSKHPYLRDIVLCILLYQRKGCQVEV